MKLNIMKRWVKALRSGKYKQGQQRLKTLNGVPKFCCLGVLCDLYIKEKGRLNWVDQVEHSRGVCGGERYFLPKPIMRWAGLKVSDPILNPGGDETAAGLNDGGKRFKTIAKLIEKAQKKKLI